MKLIPLISLILMITSFSVFSQQDLEGEVIIKQFNYGATVDELLSNSENPTLIRNVFFDIIEYNEFIGLQLDFYHSELLQITGPVKNERLDMVYRENSKIVIAFIHTFDLVTPIEGPGITYYGARIVMDPLGTVALSEWRDHP